MTQLDIGKYKSILFGLLFFLIIIDSGGPLGIRWISIGFFVATVFILFLVDIKAIINAKILSSLLAIFLLILGGFISAAMNSIDISASIAWIFFLFFLLVTTVAFRVFSHSEFMHGLVWAGYFFVTTIFGAFLALLFDIPLYSAWVLEVLSKFPGSFRLHEVFGLPYILIYFQAILTLVPCVIAAYFLNKKFATCLFLSVLLLVLSRFSVVTVLLTIFFTHLFGAKRFSMIIVYVFSPLMIAFISYYLLIYLTNYSGYVPTFGSANVRIGHIISTFDSFDLHSLIFGHGPGSFFYTIGRLEYADNTELTQLEMLRKFGLIWWAALLALINTVFYYLFKLKHYDLIIVIFSFIFVSSSQPVLMSLSFSILFGFGVSIISRPQKLLNG